MNDLTVSRARYEREKAARESAERLLEQKSRELFDANQRLESYSRQLERLIEARTKELKVALEASNHALEQFREAEQRLAQSEGKFRSFIENANDIVFTLTIDGIFDYLSPRLTDVLGYVEDDLRGHHFSSVIHPEDLPNCAEFFQRLISTQQPDSGLEYRVRHADGSWHWHDTNAAPLFDNSHNIRGMLGIGRDIHERKKDQQRLRYLAHFDSLTGLANRSSILSRLGYELAQAKASGTCLAVMFLDLNRFKAINDTHGHETGDQVLRIVSERLKLSVREYTDAVGRLAGDEFLIVLPNIDSKEDAEKVSCRIGTAISPAIELSKARIFVTSSIGVSFYPQDSIDVDSLVNHADTAMYEHKLHKTGDAVFYASKGLGK